MKLKNIYLFRHGETDWNKEQIIQGSSDIPLNEAGIIQAEKLAKELIDSEIETILSSDLQRAHKTAEIVGKYLGAKIETTKDLRETCFGECEGKYISTVKEKHANFFKAMSNINKHDCFQSCLPGGETRNEVFIRSSQAIRAFIQKNKYAKNIALSTHGGLINTFLLKHFNEHYNFGNCEFIKLYYNSEDGSISNEEQQ